MLDFKALQETTHNEGAGFSRFYPLLYTMALGMEAKHMFEFGAGFTSKVLVEASSWYGGKLTSCCDKGKWRFDHMNIDPTRWKYIEGNSNKVLANHEIKQPIGLVLHDGSHIANEVYNDMLYILPSLMQGAVILVHDVANHRYKGMFQAVQEAVYGWNPQIKYSMLRLDFGGGLLIVKIRNDWNEVGKVSHTWDVKK